MSHRICPRSSLWSLWSFTSFSHPAPIARPGRVLKTRKSRPQRGQKRPQNGQKWSQKRQQGPQNGQTTGQKGHDVRPFSPLPPPPYHQHPVYVSRQTPTNCGYHQMFPTAPSRRDPEAPKASTPAKPANPATDISGSRLENGGKHALSSAPSKSSLTPLVAVWRSAWSGLGQLTGAAGCDTLSAS